MITFCYILHKRKPKRLQFLIHASTTMEFAKKQYLLYRQVGKPVKSLNF